jgi:hypothetical protein
MRAGRQSTRGAKRVSTRRAAVGPAAGDGTGPRFRRRSTTSWRRPANARSRGRLEAGRRRTAVATDPAVEGPDAGRLRDPASRRTAGRPGHGREGHRVDQMASPTGVPGLPGGQLLRHYAWAILTHLTAVLVAEAKTILRQRRRALQAARPLAGPVMQRGAERVVVVGAGSSQGLETRKRSRLVAGLRAQLRRRRRSRHVVRPSTSPMPVRPGPRPAETRHAQTEAGRSAEGGRPCGSPVKPAPLEHPGSVP